MAVVDLKDAYYSIPIGAKDRQLLKFEWEGNYFHLTCLPNELASAPRLFTKVLKPVFPNPIFFPDITFTTDASTDTGWVAVQGLPYSWFNQCRC